MCDPWPKKFWLIEVGDDPEDGTLRGPYNSWWHAFKSGINEQDSYHMSNHNGPEYCSDDIFCFNGQISSLFVVRSETPPTYEGIRPILLRGK